MFPKFRRLQICLCSVIALLIFSGCNDAEKINNATNQSSTSEQIKTELRPQGSGEKARIHKFDADGNEFETEINFDDGKKAVATFDILGSLVEYKQYFPNSDKLAQNTKLAEKGRRVVWQEAYNTSGKTVRRWERLKNLDQEFRQFSEDGTEEVVLVMHPDGSGECNAQYSLRELEETSVQKQSWQKDGSLKVEYRLLKKKFNQLLQVYEFDKDDNMTRSFYSAGGDLICRAHWDYQGQRVPANRALTYGGWLLRQLEVPSKTEQKLYIYKNRLSPSDFYADEVRIKTSDGSKCIIQANAGEDTVRIANYDASGKLVVEVEASELDYVMLVPQDPTRLIAPEFRGSEHLKRLQSIFIVDKTILSLSPKAQF